MTVSGLAIWPVDSEAETTFDGPSDARTFSISWNMLFDCAAAAFCWRGYCIAAWLFTILFISIEAASFPLDISFIWFNIFDRRPCLPYGSSFFAPHFQDLISPFCFYFYVL